MLSPQELYLRYTLEPCVDGTFIETNGTPYDLPRFLRFLRHLKYPCIENAPYVINNNSEESPYGIKDTGSGKLGIPYKFLTKIDAEAFTEIQPTINSGTSHAVRNACDIARACDIEISGHYYKWGSRMATEYIEHFAGRSLPDCLLMLGPDLVSEDVAYSERIPGCSYKLNGIEYFFNCVQNPERGAVGADFYCKVGKGETIPKCVSCETCNPEEPWTWCCQAKTCVDDKQRCCGAPETNRLYFSYLEQNENSKLSLDYIIELRLIMDIKLSILKHIGILKRKSYGGYANFIDNSGPNFYACKDDLFLNHFQSKNNYNYTTDTSKLETDSDYVADSTAIERFKTVSFIGGNDSTRMNRVKDLLFNGYGVVLMTNVGFPNFRDSTGISYPDRIWYHTFSIIGYDDTLIEYPECVYLIANSWGEWNSGGEPSWGPIPPGSFLVTESSLKGMTKFNHSPSFKGCRSGICPDPCQDPVIKAKYAGCASKAPPGECCSGSSRCVPFDCGKYQSAFGLLFGLSTSDGFPRRSFNYKQFYPINNFRRLDNTTELYLNE